MEKQKTDEYIEAEPKRGHTRVYISTPKIVLNNFLGGLAWGFGTVLGATLIAGLLLFLLSKLNTIPFIGEMISDFLTQIQDATK